MNGRLLIEVVPYGKNPSIVTKSVLSGSKSVSFELQASPVPRLEEPHDSEGNGPAGRVRSG
jgi:hypothetical protein